MIKSLYGKALVQSVLIENTFSPQEMKHWLKENGYTYGTLKNEANYVKFEQNKIELFKRLQIKEVEPGIKIIQGFKE